MVTASPSKFVLAMILPLCAGNAHSQTQASVTLAPFATIQGAGAIYHMTEAPNGQFAVADFGRSGIALVSSDGKAQEYQGGAFISPAAIAFFSLDVGYTACNPAPLASRAFCFSGSSGCPRGSEGIAPGNQSGFSFPRYVRGASDDLTSPTFFISNGGTGEIRLMDPVKRTQSTIAGGFTVSSGSATTRGPEQIAYDSNSQRLFIADSGQNAVISVDRQTGGKTTIRAGLNWPFGLIRMRNGNLLVSNRGDGTLDEITTQGIAVAHYDTGLGPNALRGLTAAQNGLLYLLNDQNQTIYRITLGAPAAPDVSTVEAGGYRGPRVAPGSIAAAFGAGFSASSAAAESAPLPVSLAGTSLTVRDRNGAALPASLFFVSPGQVNFVVPASMPGGPGAVTVLRSDGTSLSGPVQIETVAPGLFSANGDGKGVIAATLLRVRADGSQSFEAVAQLAGTVFEPRPIDFGPDSDQLYLIFYGTGLRGRSALSAAKVTVGDLPAEVLFAGDQGGFTGLDQVNVRLPSGLRGKGEVDLTLTVDAQASNKLRISFR